jgi:hypothetical protein
MRTSSQTYSAEQLSNNLVSNRIRILRVAGVNRREMHSKYCTPRRPMFGPLSYPARTVSDMASQHEGLPEFHGDGRRDARAPHPRDVASPEWESPALNHRAHAGETGGRRQKRLNPNVNPPSQSLSRTAAPSVLRQNVTVTKGSDRLLLAELAWGAGLLMPRVVRSGKS